MTRGPDGAVVRSAAGLAAGTVLTTQLSDGTVTSTVTAAASDPPDPRPAATETGAA